MNVDTTPVKVGTGPMIIQNIGPDPLRVGFSNVTADNGLHLTAGAACVVGHTGGDIYVRSSTGNCDVRILPGGIGFFTP